MTLENKENKLNRKRQKLYLVETIFNHSVAKLKEHICISQNQKLIFYCIEENIRKKTLNHWGAI
jgi:hypothetical protein